VVNRVLPVLTERLAPANVRKNALEMAGRRADGPRGCQSFFLNLRKKMSRNAAAAKVPTTISSNIDTITRLARSVLGLLRSCRRAIAITRAQGVHDRAFVFQ